MLMDSVKLLEELSNANGVSGFEDDVLVIVRKYVDQTFNVREDCLRNLIITSLQPKQNLPRIMIEAHSDEVGFMVQSVTDHGMIHFLPLGGWLPQVPMGHKVRIVNREGENIPGIIAPAPPHMTVDAERNRMVSVNEMLIDIGAFSRTEVAERFNIDLGAPIIPDTTFTHHPGNHIVCGKAFDNRAGTAALIETLLRLKDSSLQVEPIGVVSSQEEVGTRGIQVSARRVEPDVAIVFEGTPADDTYGEIRLAQGKIGQGPQIRHRDASMITNPRFLAFAKETARAAGIRFQEAVRAKGGNDGGRTMLSGKGVPVIVIGIPVRYAHSFYCLSSMEDYELAINWGCNICQALTREIISGF